MCSKNARRAAMATAAVPTPPAPTTRMRMAVTSCSGARRADAADADGSGWRGRLHDGSGTAAGEVRPACRRRDPAYTRRSMPSATLHVPFTRDARLAILPGLLRERILVLDGAMGTMLQRHRFAEADFRGERFADHPRDVRGDNDL